MFGSGQSSGGSGMGTGLMVLLGALLANKMMGGEGLGSMLGGGPKAAPAPAPSPAGMPQGQASQQADDHGGLLDGLGGLFQKFQQNGLGGVMNSWVGTGPNQPISPSQVHQGLGPDIIDQLSQQTGRSREDIVAELSKVLPGAVDKLTPQGQLPGGYTGRV